MAILGATALVGLILVIGLPGAWLVMARWDRPTVVELGAVAGTVGLLVLMAVSIGLGQLDVFTVEVLAVAIVVVVGGTAAVSWRRGVIRRPVTDRASVAVAALGAACLVPSMRASAFVFQTGDMGAYVNSANVLADRGSIGEGFPHGFTVLLADAHLVIGEANVRLLMPALGALLVLTVGALVRRLTGSALVSVCTATILLVHPTARWFSLIPVSETLFAVVLAGTFLLLSGARRHQDPWTAVLAGAAGASLLIIRANAVAMVVVVVIGLVVSVAGDDRRTRVVQAWFNVTITFGLLVAYGYDIRYVRAYFVDSQLRVELPSGVFDLLDRLDLLRISPAFLAVVVLATVLVGGLSLVALPAEAVEAPARRRWLVPAVAGAVVVVVVAATVALGSASTTDALVRWHIVFLVLAAIGVVTLLVSTRGGADPVVVAMLLTVGASGVVLYAVRLDEPMSHAYHLYWDRYLYGDAFVVATMLAGVGVVALVTGVGALVDHHRRVAVAVGALLVVATGIGAVPLLEETDLVTQHELFGDSYGALAAVADVVPTDRSAPIVYTGAPQPPVGWFFPNTFRAYGLPLRHSFERPLLNIPVDPFAPDPTVSVARARFLIGRFGTDHGFLLRVRSAAQHLPGVGAGATLVRTVHTRVWILPRLLDRSEERYRAVDMVLELYRVDVGAVDVGRG